MNRKILWITYTGVFLALLLAVQFLSQPLGQIVTGSLVNFMLIMSLFICGYTSGAVLATLSPILAFMLNIGPKFIQLIPFICIGNLVFISIIFFAKKHLGEKSIKSICLSIATLSVASIVKFLSLYVGIVLVALPLLLNLPDPTNQVISTMFSLPQLFTALIGSAIAIVVTPFLRKLKLNK